MIYLEINIPKQVHTKTISSVIILDRGRLRTPARRLARGRDEPRRGHRTRAEGPRRRWSAAAELVRAAVGRKAQPQRPPAHERARRVPHPEPWRHHETGRSPRAGRLPEPGLLLLGSPQPGG